MILPGRFRPQSRRLSRGICRRCDGDQVRNEGVHGTRSLPQTALRFCRRLVVLRRRQLRPDDQQSSDRRSGLRKVNRVPGNHEQAGKGSLEKVEI